MAIWLERMDDMTSQAGRQQRMGGEGYPLARGSATFVLTYRHAKKKRRISKRGRRRRGRRGEKYLSIFRDSCRCRGCQCCQCCPGIIIIIFVISNLQHAHGISPASRSQKGSLSRSDNCPEQLLSTRPTQGKARPG